MILEVIPKIIDSPRQAERIITLMDHQSTLSGMKVEIYISLTNWGPGQIGLELWNGMATGRVKSPEIPERERVIITDPHHSSLCPELDCYG